MRKLIRRFQGRRQHAARSPQRPVLILCHTRATARRRGASHRDGGHPYKVGYDQGMDALVTPRLVLEPLTLPVVEATFAGDRPAIEDLVRAEIPDAWPGRVLVERAFSASLEHIRADPRERSLG